MDGGEPRALARANGRGGKEEEERREEAKREDVCAYVVGGGAGLRNSGSRLRRFFFWMRFGQETGQERRLLQGAVSLFGTACCWWRGKRRHTQHTHTHTQRGFAGKERREARRRPPAASGTGGGAAAVRCANETPRGGGALGRGRSAGGGPRAQAVVFFWVEMRKQRDREREAVSALFVCSALGLMI